MTDHIAPSLSRRTVLRALTAGSVAVGLGAAGFAAPALSAVSGLDVRELQIRLAGWVSDEPRQAFLPITGVFDKETDAAVRRFQRAYGLPPNGVTEPATLDRLAALSKPDGSTLSFEWADFSPPDDATVREHTRRLMYKLEALRHKLDGRKVIVTDGFRGSGDGMHTSGGTADITVAGLTTYAVYRAAQTCGFSGLGPPTQSWLHCDSRAELGLDGGTEWSWVGGTIR